MVQLMSLPPTVSCFNKIQIGFTFLVPAHPGSPRQRAVKRMLLLLCSSFVDDDMFAHNWPGKGNANRACCQSDSLDSILLLIDLLHMVSDSLGGRTWGKVMISMIGLLLLAYAAV